MLYTCAKEFDFLGTEMPIKTTATLLLPVAIIVSLIVVWRMLKQFVQKAMKKDDEEECEDVDPAVAYNVVQMLVYGFMAVMIMRLKLFWSPHLCVVAGLLASFKVQKKAFRVI